MLDWPAVRMSFPYACALDPDALSKVPADPEIAKVRIGVAESVNSWGSSSLGSVLSIENVRDPAESVMR